MKNCRAPCSPYEILLSLLYFGHKHLTLLSLPFAVLLQLTDCIICKKFIWNWRNILQKKKYIYILKINFVIPSLKHTTFRLSSHIFVLVSFNFLNYILLIMLLQLSWFSPLRSLSTQHFPLPQALPPPLFMSTPISSLATPFPILYFTSPWPFCNYLFVLLIF